ncbi:MAG: hypothetical protein ACLVJK_12330 [Alistipes putredinis]
MTSAPSGAAKCGFDIGRSDANMVLKVPQVTQGRGHFAISLHRCSDLRV